MPEVFGRETEIAEIRRFVGRIPEGPSAFTLQGVAGIGKSTLWNAGLGYARELGFGFRACRSTPSEAELSYAGLADVLGEVPPEALESLPEVQRHALEVALLRVQPGVAPIDHRTVAAATLGVLRWFASSGPVLMALDDPQWMDDASRTTLAYAIRRLDREPVGVLAAVRTGEGTADPLQLSRALPDERTRWIEVGPLPREAMGRMLAERLGWAPQDSALFELHTVSGGNPLFSLEIARASLRDPERSLVVPRSLHEQVSERLSMLPAATREALVVAASLPRPTLGLIERAVECGGKDILGPAVRAGTVEVLGDSVRFTHPLYGSVSYADARSEERARIHRRLAWLVSDPEERARHLALGTTPPEGGVADVLEEAAERARSRGAQMAAADLCLEARRFTPQERGEDARRRIVLAADDLHLTGDQTRVKVLLEDALGGCSAGSGRAHVLWRLGRLAGMGDVLRIEDAGHWLDRAEEEAAGDPGLLSRINRLRCLLGWQRFDFRHVVRDAHAALEMAERAGESAGIAAALGQVAWAEAFAGRGVAEDVVARAMTMWTEAENDLHGGSIVSEDHPALGCGAAFVNVGRLDEARSMFEILARDARERGSDLALSFALPFLVEIDLLAGEWERASAHLDEFVRRHMEYSVVDVSEGQISACLGRAEEARRVLAPVVSEGEAAGWVEPLHDALRWLGFLELSVGDLAEAHRYLSRATEIFLDAGPCEPGVFHQAGFLPDAIEVLIGLGELGEAERHTDWLEERGRALDRPWALATGARSRGLLSAAKGDLGAALGYLDRAVREHERLPMPFERARTSFALGSIRRRAKRKREAREALVEALAVFDRLGARLWADKARAELSSIGGRPAAAGGLTPTEERVARLAAAGRTNREIADALYLSVRTVETHLSRAYHKLGVRSRTELALVLDGSQTT
jgi:DNA-binding CsgD family transcriptional regulator